MISTSIDKFPVFFYHIENAWPIFLRKIVKTSNYCPIIAMNFFIFQFFIDFPWAFKSISLTRKNSRIHKTMSFLLVVYYYLKFNKSCIDQRSYINSNIDTKKKTLKTTNFQTSDLLPAVLKIWKMLCKNMEDVMFTKHCCTHCYII